MLATGPYLGLTTDEVTAVRTALGREPNETEWAIINAEWSEHSSYKSSKAVLRSLPTKGKRVLLGPGYDAGVVDVGKGYAVTLHIESHNHPSAVDPYGGAATGVGGVLRDILSVGSRPIALVDVLRFGDPQTSGHSKWLLRNVVRGIADYGNCVGVPTVAGEIEFDESFERNCLVDVACIGVARKRSIVLGAAKQPGDLIVLIGGSTGRDGVGGAAFASKNLSRGSESDRSSVQVPDPFMKKLLLDALLEISEAKLVRAMKDLGGGGLSTALSEIASSGGTGADAELNRVMLREADMTPTEIMTSESQERMLLVLNPGNEAGVFEVLDKYEVPHSVIGTVTADGMLRVRWNGRIVADLPARVVAEAPLIMRTARKPAYLGRLPAVPAKRPKLAESILALLSSPNISSRSWVYEQYDHEVGLRTVLKPGDSGASLLRLPNGSMLAVKADGNSRHCYLDPSRGAAGCVAEACRNVVAVGAEPIAMVDHLQFGDPSDEEVYWTFKEAVRGMSEYCSQLPIPVVGGKVSFYNEDASTKRAIKPSPVAMVVGLLSKPASLVKSSFNASGESVFVVGFTKKELGGSEYCVSLLKTWGGSVPVPDPRGDARTYRAVRRLVRSGLASAVHDCSRGGLAIGLGEMTAKNGVGARVEVAKIPSEEMLTEDLLFSESHGRFIVTTRSPSRVREILATSGVIHSKVGETGGRSLELINGGKVLVKLPVSAVMDSWKEPLTRLMD